MFAVTPKCNEVQVRRVEHQFDADQYDDGVAPCQRDGQADAEEQGRQHKVCGKWSHGFAKHQTPKAKLQKNPKPQTSKGQADIRLGIRCLELLWCLMFGI